MVQVLDRGVLLLDIGMQSLEITITQEKFHPFQVPVLEVVLQAVLQGFKVILDPALHDFLCCVNLHFLLSNMSWLEI